MAEAMTREAREKAWWDAWWAEDYSWPGLAKKCVGENYDKVHGGLHGEETLQDYWRRDPTTGAARDDKALETAGDLIRGPDGTLWHVVHAPLNWSDGKRAKSSWSEGEQGHLAALVSAAIAAAAATKVSSVCEAGEPDGRAQLSGAVLLSPPGHRGSGLPLHLTAVGAWLPEWSVKGAIFGPGAHFEKAMFSGDVAFENAAFLGNASFVGATFLGQFSLGQSSGSQFLGRALFVGSIFSKHALFWNSHFRDEADFSSAMFRTGATFISTTFSSMARFNATRFDGDGVFNGATFSYATFADASFLERAYFVGADWEQNAVFRGARFTGVATFNDARFGGLIDFAAAVFDAIASFERIQWPREARDWHSAFDKVWFRSVLNLSGSGFRAYAAFGGATLERGVQIDDASEAHANATFRGELCSAAASAVSDAKDWAEAENHLRQEPDRGNEKAVTRREIAAQVCESREARLRQLESGCRVLKQAMERASNKSREQLLYRFELRARRAQRNLPFGEKTFSYLYGVASDYGASMWRPFAALALLIAMFAAVFWGFAAALDPLVPSQIMAGDLRSQIWSVLNFSWANVFKPLSALASDGAAEEGTLMAAMLDGEKAGTATCSGCGCWRRWSRCWRSCWRSCLRWRCGGGSRFRESVYCGWPVCETERWCTSTREAGRSPPAARQINTDPVPATPPSRAR